MSNSKINNAHAEMMIRKPIGEVFNAFIEPSITSKFWFTEGSDKLQMGKQVEWTWAMYKLTIPVVVKAINLNESILIEWGTGAHKSTVRWDFKSLADDKTFVSISNYNFLDKGEELMAKIVDSTGGFTIVLAGLKAWLEHGIELNLIGDKFPEELRK